MVLQFLGIFFYLKFFRTFYSKSDVKIFDFGLAKELDESKILEDGTYNLTGDTGSLHSMAPEGNQLFSMLLSENFPVLMRVIMIL